MREPDDETLGVIAGIDASLRVAIRRCVTGEAPWPLFVFGSAGVGKTWAARAMIRVFGGIYYAAPDLCGDTIQAGKGELRWSTGYVKTPQEIWNSWKLSPLAVLDELGTAAVASDYTRETVKRAIDAREGKPLVAIANHALAALERVYDDRIASRLGAGTIIEVRGNDRRILRTP